MAMGAWVTFDPEWDPVHAYATEDEARAAVLAGHGSHYLQVPDATVDNYTWMAALPKPWDAA